MHGYLTKWQYTFGFNGKEQDKETTGTTTYDYGFRIYSLGRGRFLSLDPLTAKYAKESPFIFVVGGNLVIFHDPDGRDRITSNTTIYDFGNGNVLSFVSKRIINQDFSRGIWLT